jgi:hypothetical protein
MKPAVLVFVCVGGRAARRSMLHRGAATGMNESGAQHESPHATS